MRATATVLRVFGYLVLVFSLGGCPDERRETSRRHQVVEGSNARSAVDEADGDLVVLRGTVIRKPWAKTYESWNAGGSEYYVLDVGDTDIRQRSAKEGVILRPSEEVPFPEFEKYRDQRVRVKGRFVEARSYEPAPGSPEQYPVDPTTGRPEPRGSGFQVYELQLAVETSRPDEIGS